MAEMDEQEEMYGDEGENYEDEIPVDDAGQPGDATLTGEGGAEELESMKKKLKEMEDEAARLRALQTTVTGATPDAATPGATVDTATKEEADSRSIYVGGVDYACTPEELQQHFQSCGTVNRVTILTDKFGNPKGYAYVEFLEVDAVNNAVLLDNTELRGRNIKVVQKRTNVPGLKARGRGRGRGGPYMGARGMGPAMYGMPMPIYGMPAAYAPRGRGGYPGFVPRGRGRGRFYAPY